MVQSRLLGREKENKEIRSKWENRKCQEEFDLKRYYYREQIKRNEQSI